MASLDGRRFRSVAEVAGGEFGAGTIFEHHQDGDLVGLRQGDRLDFRYGQLNTAGETSNGHCVSMVVTLPDGPLRLDETWERESRPVRSDSLIL